MIDIVTACGTFLSSNGAVPGPGSYQSVSPGIQGFLAIFGVVLATVALMFSMTRHIRKIDHNARIDAERAQAELDRATAEKETSRQGSVRVDQSPTSRASDADS